MVFNIIFYLCFIISFQQENQNFIKISLDNKSSSPIFYINASFKKDNSVILPLKLDLNLLTTSMNCKYIPYFSEENIITCNDNLCYKLFYDEDTCDESSKNNCTFISSNIYDFDNKKKYSGFYIKNYFNIFINNTFFQEKNNIFPIGCIDNNYNNIFKESSFAGIFALGGDLYSFLPYFYKENEFKQNNSFFGICLDPQEGGFLSFGKIIDKFHVNNDMHLSFKYNVKDSYYTFKINNMFFNYEIFNKNEYEAIFNMDIEFSYVNKDIINELYHLFKKYLSKKLLKKYQLDLIININEIDLYGICFVNNDKKDIQFKEKLISIFPPFFIGIQNKYYKWNSEYYLYKKNINKENEKDEYCIGLLSNEKRNKENKNVVEFGVNFMYGHEIIFNFTKKEIIVYESNCSMKSKKKIDIILESKYDKINRYLKIVIIILSIIAVFMLFTIYRLSKRRSACCIKLFGKQVTNEEINKFFNANYNIIN